MEAIAACDFVEQIGFGHLFEQTQEENEILPFADFGKVNWLS